HDGVIDVFEALVDPFPTRSEAPAGTRPGEAPDRAADRRQHGVAKKRGLEHSGRDRDERARDGRHPADENRPLLPAPKPALGPFETRFVEMEPASAALEQRPTPVEPDRPAGKRTK